MYGDSAKLVLGAPVICVNPNTHPFVQGFISIPEANLYEEFLTPIIVTNISYSHNFILSTIQKHHQQNPPTSLLQEYKNFQLNSKNLSLRDQNYWHQKILNGQRCIRSKIWQGLNQENSARRYLNMRKRESRGQSKKKNKGKRKLRKSGNTSNGPRNSEFLNKIRLKFRHEE